MMHSETERNARLLAWVVVDRMRELGEDIVHVVSETHDGVPYCVTVTQGRFTGAAASTGEGLRIFCGLEREARR